MRLAIHESALANVHDLTLDGILTNINDIVSKCTSDVYLVGFSTGAVLAILYATQRKVSGILAISSFFKPHRASLAKIAALLAVMYPRIPILRRLQTTKKQVRRELMLSRRTIPIGAIRFATEVGQQAFDALSDVTCPILFFHSVDDKVSRYSSIPTALRKCSPGSRLVTFSSINHFLQFDLPTNRVCLFAMKFFGLPPGHSADVSTQPADVSTQPADAPAPSASDLLRIYRDEQRHWAITLLQINLRALVAFALLLYNTLHSIVAQTQDAPYFLLSYTALLSMYLILITLYFFYLNRVDAYIKACVDPLIKTISWTTFRTNEFVSGRESTRITRLTTLPLFGFPFAIATISLVFCAWGYKDQIFVIGKLEPLQIAFLVVLVLFLYMLFFVYRHRSFARRWLYLAGCGKSRLCGKAKQAIAY
jgi:esterase/lipase